MSWVIRSYLLFSLFLAEPARAFDQASPKQAKGRNLRMRVWLYNYAGIETAALDRAKWEAGRIFRHVGITVDWLDCQMSVSQAAEHPVCVVDPVVVSLVLRIQPESPFLRLIRGGRRSSDIFGHATLPVDGEFGVFADVNAAGAELLTRDDNSLRPAILGHLIAHEIGHLLLRTAQHAATGIMTARWGRKEIRLASQGALMFTARESRLLCVGLEARWTANNYE